MRGVRFTKAELEQVRIALQKREAACLESPGKKTYAKACASALSKLDAAEAPQDSKPKGLPVGVAIEAFREALGDRLVLPPNPTAGWYAQMGTRLGLLGLSRQDCVSVARVAAAEWRGFVKAESLIRQADTLLHSAQMTLPGIDQGEPDELTEL